METHHSCWTFSQMKRGANQIDTSLNITSVIQNIFVETHLLRSPLRRTSPCLCGNTHTSQSQSLLLRTETVKFHSYQMWFLPDRCLLFPRSSCSTSRETSILCPLLPCSLHPPHTPRHPSLQCLAVCVHRCAGPREPWEKLCILYLYVWGCCSLQPQSG